MVLVEIEKGLAPDAAVCYHPGLWMFALYDAGTVFPWFAPSSLGASSVKVCGSVIVDGYYYTKVEGGINALYDKTYCQIENIVFVKTPDFTPLWSMEYVRATYSVGLSDSAAFVRNTIYYKPVLIYQLAIQEKVDNNNYGSMVFRSDTLRIRNDNGEYDDVTNYFGNLIRVHTWDNGIIRDWFELYIKNVSITSNLVTFTCGDKRERLKFKVPNTRFTKEAYPFLKDDLVGELKQDVYGNCQWVKCVCVDELDIYAEEAPAETEEEEEEGEEQPKPLKKHRTFYVSRKITELKLTDTRPDKNNAVLANHVWIKQTQVTETDEEEQFGIAEQWTPCPVKSVNREKGEFTLDIKYCMPSGTWEGYDAPEVFEVRACGVFNPQRTPLAVITDLMDHYAGLPYTSENYDKTAIEREIGSLAPIGLVLDSDQELYEVIGRLQTSSDYSFKFLTAFDKFSAKRDDNERDVRYTIPWHKIVSAEKITIDLNLEYYSTINRCGYNKNYYTDNSEFVESKVNRIANIIQYGIEKEFAPETLLDNKAGAETRVTAADTFFSKIRPLINEVQVLGYTDIELYDIIQIDLRIPVSKKREVPQLVALFSAGIATESVLFGGGWKQELTALDIDGEEEGEGFRAFGGFIRCKVLGYAIDLETNITTLNLVYVG